MFGIDLDGQAENARLFLIIRLKELGRFCSKLIFRQAILDRVTTSSGVVDRWRSRRLFKDDRGDSGITPRPVSVVGCEWDHCHQAYFAGLRQRFSLSFCP